MNLVRTEKERSPNFVIIERVDKDNSERKTRPDFVKCNNADMFSSTARVVVKSWTFFSSKIRAGGPQISAIEASATQTIGDGFLLLAWKMTATVEANVESSESNMKEIEYSTTEDDQGRFTRLTGFRRDVGGCYDDLKVSNRFARIYLEKPLTFTYGVLRQSFEFSLRWREAMEKPILAHLAELEKKLDAIKEDLNEEMQVAVGTVRIRDAQLMREQTAVMARQTKWTVALTVLAAVYLPMTLVTGIFGMNITEISSEATAPNARWVVGA